MIGPQPAAEEMAVDGGFGDDGSFGDEGGFGNDDNSLDGEYSQSFILLTVALT